MHGRRQPTVIAGAGVYWSAALAAPAGLHLLPGILVGSAAAGLRLSARHRTTKATVGLSSARRTNGTAQVNEDNVGFVILLVMGIVLAVAVFCYVLFMSEIHVG